MSELIPLEKINAVEVFTEDGMAKLLKKIRAEAQDFEADVSTAAGRQDCKSMAYKITLSKGVIDRAGKGLVAEAKQKIKVVDAARRQARQDLDDLAAEVRQPLTEWEAAEEARIAAEKLREEINTAHEQAILEDQLWEERRENERLRAAEEERQRQEVERVAREQAELEEAERQERIRKEAEERAAQEAQDRINEERRQREAAEQAAKDAEERREREAKEAEERAKREREEAVEQERLRLIREQEERDAERRRIQAEADERERIRQENAEHRRAVNAGALAALIEQGFGEEDAKGFITAVYQGKIPGIQMVY